MRSDSTSFNLNCDDDHTLYDLITKKDWEGAKSYLSPNSFDGTTQLEKGVSFIHNEGNFSPLAAAIFHRAPNELILQIFQLGGKKLLKVCDKFGSSPLHLYCIVGTSEEIFQVLLKDSDLDDLILMNNKGYTPLDLLLSHGSSGGLVGKVIIMQRRLYELDMRAETIPLSTKQNLLRWTNELPQQADQDLVLKEPLARIILNDTFLQHGCLAILLADIYCKLSITFVYSFILYDIINGDADTRNALIILSICLYWTMSRELSQIATTTLKTYVLDIVNWFDFSQLVFLVLSLRILMSFDGEISTYNRLTFMIATTIAWLEVLLAFGVLIKDIALFAVALIKIAGRLGPFFFTTIILLAMFAHVFILANAGGDNLLCSSMEVVDKVDWTCTISASYFETIILLLTGEMAFSNKADGFANMAPSMLFRFAIGILFLNISIAVITDAYNDVKTYESKRFTRNRLAFAAGSQSLLSILLYQRFCVRNKRPSGTMAMKTLWSLERHEFSRIPFGTFPEPKLLDNLPLVENNVLKWWFESWTDDNAVPPFFLRIRVFFQRASIDEILFPGKTFENILVGLKHRKRNSSIVSSLLSRISSYTLFFTIWVWMLIIFLAGCVSFGLLWPQFIRETLFLEAM